MKFGVNFFPTVDPSDAPAHRVYDENLRLAALADTLGYEHIKTVEHYFFGYGGYSPDPVTFLAAAAARTTRIRLVTGAVIPAFTHPIKLAGKLAMLDNLSKGRLDVGFGRAFLPDEFEAFGITMDSSRARFDEGVAACKLLWSTAEAVWEGPFHRFGPVTMLPRPYQRPHPPIFVATAASMESCTNAGIAGHHLQLAPFVGTRERIRDLLDTYRKAWIDGGNESGSERIQLSYTLYLADDRAHALRTGKQYEENYVQKLTEAVESWTTTNSSAYPGYDKIVEQVKKIDFTAAVRDNKILAGTPEDVREQIATIGEWYGTDVSLSMRVNPGTMPVEEAAHTLRQFASTIAPEFDPEFGA
jgi:alkanesulfonate monooxygenase SsuD/methylene tetrahydromethanopterin reductase-like flavin-dependent oxidoreductase (luciferase family)